MGHLTKQISLLLIPILMLGSIIFAGDKSRVKIGGSVVVSKHEQVDDAVAVGGDAKIYGKVYGSAVSVGGDIYLGPDAVVHDDCVSVGGEIHMSEGAAVYGEIIEVDDFNFAGEFFEDVWHDNHWSLPWGFKVFPFLAILVIGAVLIAILPKQFNFVTNTIDMETGKSFLTGLAGMILFIPAILTLVVSLLGIPLIPIFVVVVMLLMFFGYFSTAAVLGGKLINKMGNTTSSAILHIVAGLFLLWLIGFIPFLGGLARFIAFLIGWGAVLLVLNNWRLSKKPQPILPTPSPVEPEVKTE
ncbi:MAG: hypothetical protein HQ509_05245 [Candidatus Marinimicrobia bacterium]|nr:hypothetical protein [Candidatus Neomarinimicrobiota bacterium]